MRRLDDRGLNAIRLICHPKGREAMVGWGVSTELGDGVIVGFRNDRTITMDYEVVVRLRDGRELPFPSCEVYTH